MAAEDLEARVARLEQAVGAAGSILADTGRTTPGVPLEGPSGTPTPPVNKGIRTVIQLGVASIPGLGLAATLQSPLLAWVVTLVLTPLVAYLQNTLEDGHRVVPILRDVGPLPPGTERGSRRRR